MDAELLRQYLEFYRDLGIKTLYKQSAPAHQSGTDAFVRQPGDLSDFFTASEGAIYAECEESVLMKPYTQ